MTSRKKKRYKQALAGFDEINTFWVDKMILPEPEKRLRVEMMRDMREKLKTIPKLETEDSGFDYVMFTAIGYVAYKALYQEFVEKYYLRYLRAVGANGQMSDFAEYWINNHAESFAGYKHTDPQATSRTETNALASLAQLDAFFQMGYNRKQWLTMGDSRVRLTHQEAAGQIRLLEEPFLVGNSFLMFPQDSSLGASASEIVNCRCTMRPIK